VTLTSGRVRKYRPLLTEDTEVIPKICQASNSDFDMDMSNGRGQVRSDASDLTLAHSHSHKLRQAAAVMRVNNVLGNSYNTRPLAMRAHVLRNIYNTSPLAMRPQNVLCNSFSISLAVQSVTSLTALLHS
jgi:hypothetical protein